LRTFDVVIFGGDVGSGKTTSAELVRAETGGVIIDPDVIRRELGCRDYSLLDKPRVMADSRRGVRQLVRSASEPVLLSATFATELDRALLYRWVDKASDGFRARLNMALVWCECSAEESRRRVALRPGNDGLHMPTNDPAVYDRTRSLAPVGTEFAGAAFPNVSCFQYDTQHLNIEPRVVRAGHGDYGESLSQALLRKC
jgi:predicted kinase